LFEYLNIKWLYSDRIADARSVYLLIYLWFTLRELSKFKKVLKSNYSSISSNELRWIKHFLIGVMVVASLDLLLGAYKIFYGDHGFGGSFMVLMSIIVLITYLGYHGTTQSAWLLPGFLLEEESHERKLNYHLSAYSSDELNQWVLKLDEVLRTQKPFLDPDLTLSKLAESIQITDKKLSALLNQHMQTSFFDYINKYRVDEVKEKIVLPEYEYLTLLGIAYECGFNSKSSFNRIFKKETGFSPSEYRTNLKKGVPLDTMKL